MWFQGIDGPQIALYPRISIDNSRRVRQLAHTLQGALTISTGKRIASHLSKAVGPWLSGLYDSDRSVARAAKDALTSAFGTEEKRQALWKLYKEVLLEYVEDAVLVQTTDTLSDERTTSKDDAEAKRARVAGSAMNMFVQLCRANGSGDSKSHDFRTKATQIIGQSKLWEYAHDADPYLRRAICLVANFAADNFRSNLDWPSISTHFVNKGTSTSQLGSATQFAETLVLLTKIRPDIWTEDYRSKTPVSRKLLQFLRKGSQRGTEAYWTSIAILIRTLPRTVLSKDNEISIDDGKALTEAFRSGVTNFEEPRQNLVAAWSCYIDTCLWLSTQTSGSKDFLQSQLIPLVTNFVQPTDAEWTLPTTSSSHLAARAVAKLLDGSFEDLLVSLWTELCNFLIDKMRVSLPETSKDFSKSQESVITQSGRFFRLKAEAVRQTESPARENVREGFEASYRVLISASVDLLRSRNGKPYSAAGVLQDLLVNTKVTKTDRSLISLLDDDLLNLLQTPSAARLISIWQACDRPLRPILQQLAKESSLTPYGQTALGVIVGSASAEDIEATEGIKAQLLATPRSSAVIILSHGILQNSNLTSSSITAGLVDNLLEYLSPDTQISQQASVLSFLEEAVGNPVARSNLMNGTSGSTFLSRLVLLSESPDAEVGEPAKRLLAKCKSSGVNGTTSSSATLRIVEDQFAGSTPLLSVEMLVDLAVDEYTRAESKSKALDSILPSFRHWQAAQSPDLFHKRSPSFAISSPLQGVVFVLDSDSQTSQVKHDEAGLSMNYRLCLYAIRTASRVNLMEVLSEDQAWSFYTFLLFGLELINEKLTIEQANEDWSEITPEMLDEAADMLSQGKELISAWLNNDKLFPFQKWTEYAAYLGGTDGGAYIECLAFIDVASRLVERDGASSLVKALAADGPSFPRSSDLLRAATVCCSLRDYLVSAAPNRQLLNQLISSATDLKPVRNDFDAFRPVVLLNILLNGDSDVLQGLPSQRLVFLMQSLVRLLCEANDEWAVVSEIFKLLMSILPAVQDIYGDHWQQVLDSVLDVWHFGIDLENDLPVLHSSLRLYQTIKKLAATDEANEDLIDACSTSQIKFEQGLLQCLQLFGTPADGYSQPRKITVQLLGRLLSDISIGSIDDILHLVLANEPEVYEIAYTLLHKAVPDRQEDMSLELALEKQTIHLPADLLSFIADGPPLQEVPSKHWLLAWNLVFDHFSKASFKLREAYTSDLKDAAHVARLLDYLCDVLRITSGRPVDASKFEIEQFDLSRSESADREQQWLAIHVYYRCLLLVPGLVKAWYIEQKNRIKSPLDSWTHKHISPLIVVASLDIVSDWAKTQDQDDNPITVKSSTKSYELIATMEIDPESPPIAIAVVLPANYPLDSPAVIGRTRVGVSDKNWQSWMRTFQIIIFSSGSIIEGLVAFRRNVQGALKGQGECAICYSIIGTDMQTPNKKCSTCKHTFHGSCLFRWFKSSNSSTCPLCRNAFNYA